MNHNFLLWILCFGVFGILSTELGMMGIIPIVAQKFSVSIDDAGWSVSVFALMIVFCAPIAPLLGSKFAPKKLMLFCLAIFSLTSLAAAFVDSFWALLICRAIPAFFHPIYIALALSMATSLATTKEESLKNTAKVFAGVSAGMVLGVPIASFLGGNYSFAFAMGFFALCTSLAFIATLLFVPNMTNNEAPKITTQLEILKFPFLWVSIFAVVCVNAGVFGFYSYFSDFLHSITQVSFDFISVVLAVYGSMNIVGNIIAGKALAKNANATILATLLGMICLYALIFVFAKQGVVLLIFAVLLGILAGVVNNATHYVITHPYPQAPDFTNGLFLSIANIGLSTGVALCGLCISLLNTQYTALCAIVLLSMGVATMLFRMRLEKA
ncbi:MFS transporter [Helicobacter cinaedi]|uniref:MFS transporter n=1 Tax=Helicobacter cinaedi TaxID=213 RepID=UPI000D7C911A|nr:MFS transporter [Helicobacter cinaedi]